MRTFFVSLGVIALALMCCRPVHAHLLHLGPWPMGWEEAVFQKDNGSLGFPDRPALFSDRHPPGRGYGRFGAGVLNFSWNEYGRDLIDLSRTRTVETAGLPYFGAQGPGLIFGPVVRHRTKARIIGSRRVYALKQREHNLAPVPIPGAAWLFCTGVFLLIGIRKTAHGAA